MLSSPLVPASARELSELSLHCKLPAITMFAEFPRTGGLFSYGPDLQAANRQVGLFVGKILTGSAPGNLPVERPVKFELIINARTAEALGIAIPIIGQARLVGLGLTPGSPLSIRAPCGQVLRAPAL
jgi:putative ABC transport system substrate-binding protein